MNALFRCDATTDIGFGHLSRCIALAEAFRLFAANSRFAGQYDEAAKSKIVGSGFDYIDVPQPVNSGDETEQIRDADVLIVDSYRAEASYLERLRTTGPRIVAIDDFNALESYPCDVVLNFTWEAPSLAYPDGPLLLLGPEYFLARRMLVELRAQSFQRKRVGPMRNLLVAIGGADPKRIAARLVRILSGHTEVCLRVIAADDDDLQGPLTAFAPGSAVLPRQPDLAEHLLWADACITGGGLIKYEAAFMGVPAAAISQNQGQADESVSLSSAGLVFDLGLADDRSDEQLGEALGLFLSNETLRGAMADCVRGSFPPDPSAHAARAILDAVKG